mgnify:CR=1 FL=1
MKFKELSDKAKLYAVCDYLKGWRETHNHDDLSIDNVKDILFENNESIYDVNGNYIGEFDR